MVNIVNPTMQILLNKRSVEVPEGMSLQALSVSQDLDTKYVAIAVNMHVIKRDSWEQTLLKEGDSITIIGISKGG
ncbi:Thiamine biosynthesis protein ThiS [Porphyromonas cangingivalis]|nr:Thiamine biosynthesis protein ThiS [Porphyromonas cangingivalis]